ncbi:hypothetical protein ACWEFJ_18760 [Actinosynnema sp. NPDC004786]
MTRRVLPVLLTVVALLCTPATAGAGPHPPYTPLNPSAIELSQWGRFTGQVTFTNLPWVYAWSFKISESWAVGIVGPVTEFTTLDCDGKRIAANDHVEYPDYLFHGSSAVNSSCGEYYLFGRLDFVRLNQKGWIEYWDRFTVALARDGGTTLLSLGSGIRHGVEGTTRSAAARAGSVPVRRTTLPA